MTFDTILIFTVSLILLWIKPGPGQALKITRTLNDGFFAGFYLVLGITTGCVLFFLIATLGTTMLTNFFNQASIFLKIIGGTYLIYLGYKGFRNIRVGQWTGRLDKSEKKEFIENYSIGLFTTLANPLPIFYFLGIMPSLVLLDALTPDDILTGVMIIITVGLVVDSSLLLLVQQVKEALSDRKFVTKINTVTSTGFILIGLFLIISIFFKANT